MAELLKDQLSLNKIISLAQAVSRQVCDEQSVFNIDSFQQVLPAASLWQELTLMERVRSAAQAFYDVMPEGHGADIILATLKTNNQLSSWLSLVCCEYVAVNDNVAVAKGLFLLQQMTEFFSAEFAIRHYLLKQPEITLMVLKTWLKHDNYHVRRLISEGTRPRLPWGVRLPLFIEQPDRVMPLLSALKDDEQEYVRRSVANHLNDIAKDHPELVIATAKAWLAEKSLASLTAIQKKNRIKLIRHACRTLLKQGNSEVLEIFGYLPVTDVSCSLLSSSTKVPFSGDFEFELILEKTSDAEQESLLMIDYVVHFQRANGKTAAKVFKWLDRRLTKVGIERIRKKALF